MAKEAAVASVATDRLRGASCHCPRLHSQRNGARTSCPLWASNVHRSPRVVEWHPKQTGCPRAGGSARLRPSAPRTPLCALLRAPLPVSIAAMPAAQNEAFSRVLIDRALEFSGWNLLDPHQVRFELNTITGRADYLLAGGRGPLCVLEAKRQDVDPYDAREQGRGYAENLRAPFIILSNGREHWFWNYTRADQDAYRIERLPSPEDLERLRLKNLQPPRPLPRQASTIHWLRSFKSDLTLRRYQIIASDTLCRLFDNRSEEH